MILLNGVTKTVASFFYLLLSLWSEWEAISPSDKFIFYVLIVLIFDLFNIVSRTMNNVDGKSGFFFDNIFAR